MAKFYIENKGELEMVIGDDVGFNISSVPTSIMYAGLLGDMKTFSLVIHFGRPKNLFFPVGIEMVEVEKIKIYPRNITPQKLTGSYEF